MLFVTQADSLMTKHAEANVRKRMRHASSPATTQQMAIERLDIQAGRIGGETHLSESRLFNADGNIN